MPFDSLRQRLLEARKKDLEAEQMGEMSTPTALGAVSEAGAEQIGKRLDEVGKQQKILADQAWDRVSAPVGPQLPENTPEEIARSKELVAGVAGSLAPTKPFSITRSPEELIGMAGKARNQMHYNQLRTNVFNSEVDKAMKSGMPQEEAFQKVKEYLKQYMPEDYSPKANFDQLRSLLK